MWKVTGDEIWRQRGWDIYQAIEKHCKTAAGYASILNVREQELVAANSMPRCAPPSEWEFISIDHDL
jgi:mannosyl-oligosaccharide alpha-1,2-mannosidase